MAIIRTYQRQVGTSGQTGAQQVDARAMTQGIRAIGEAAWGVAGAVKQIKDKRDNISTISGTQEYNLAQKAMKDRVDARVQELAQEEKEYTPEELRAETSKIWDEYRADFDARIAPRIKNDELLAKMRGEIDAGSGVYGAELANSAYTKHKTANTLTNLEVTMGKLVDDGDYEAAKTMIDNAKEDIGSVQHNVYMDKLRRMQGVYELGNFSNRGESISRSLESGEITWQDAKAKLDSLSSEVDSSNMSSGQKYSAKQRIEGMSRKIETGVKQAAQSITSQAGEMVKNQEDASPLINANADFLKSVYGEDTVETLYLLNTAQSMDEIMEEKGKELFGTKEYKDAKALRKEVMKELNAERNPLYNRVKDVTGWGSRNNPSTVDATIHDIASSGLPSDEKAVLIGYVLDKNQDDLGGKHKWSMSASKEAATIVSSRRFERVLDAYNSAARSSNDPDIYTTFIDDWSEINRLVESGASDEDVNAKIDNKRQAIIDEGARRLSVNNNRLALFGMARTVALQEAEKKSAKDYDIGETAVIDGVTWRKIGDEEWEEVQ